MDKICYIIGAGDVDTFGCKAGEDDFIICADGGYKFNNILGRECDLVVGDFDSLGEIPVTDRKKVLPCEKDETDMDVCVSEGMKRGYRTFVIFGGLGGDRPDHSIANIQLLHKIASLGAAGFLVWGERIFTAVKDSSVLFDENCKGYFSVFSLTDESRGVTLRNLKYEINDFTLPNGRPVGVSNEFIGKRAEVEVSDGVLLLYWCGKVSDISIKN